jgi:DinB superfamily
MTVFGVLQRIFVESMSRNASLDDLKGKLERSGAEITRRLKAASNRSLYIGQAQHVTGIERWGQRRLRVVLGEPLVVNEYDSYRPDKLKDMRDLAEAFAAARQSTLSLIDDLKKAGVSPDRKILHNEMGEITIRAWLYYLHNHSYRETRLIQMSKVAQAS